MPPRPTSACSRALQRQLISPSDSKLGLSEALLASVFERYFALSHVPRRRASSTPGPLECRRRLGKRRIGDLNASYTPSSLPDWASHNALDLSNWTWEPPTVASVRDARRQAQLQLAQHWLGRLLVPSSIAEQAQATEPPPPPTPLESLEQFRLRVCSAEPLPDLRQACDDICLQLRNSKVSTADGRGLLGTLGIILHALNKTLESPRDALSISVPLYAAVVERLFAQPIETLAKMDQDLDRHLLAHLFDVPAGDELCRLFSLTLKSIPAKQRADTATHIRPILDKFFVSWSDAAMDSGTWSQILGIASALSRLGASALPSVFRDAEELLLGLPGAPDQQYRIRYAWLNVLARIRDREDSGREAFLRAWSTLFGDRDVAAAVSDMDICDVLMERHAGRSSNWTLLQEVFRDLSSPDRGASFAALAEALHTADNQWESGVMQLCEALRALGRVDQLATSFRELGKHQPLSRRLLKRVSEVSDDYRVALSLHALWRSLPRKSSNSFWKQEMWSKYLDQALSDPSAHIGDVWKLLGLCNPTDRTAQMAARIAYEHARSVADDLSRRARLRRAENCIRLLRERDQRLPPRVLIAVYRLVTKDLAELEMGRTTRLNWFLDLVCRECGRETAEECRNLLRSWRQMVGRVRARDERGAEEDADG